MKKLLLSLCILSLCLSGCNVVGPVFSRGHSAVFGCPPVEPFPWKPVEKSKSLDAVGSEECPKCYKRPACAEAGQAQVGTSKVAPACPECEIK